MRPTKHVPDLFLSSWQYALATSKQNKSQQFNFLMTFFTIGCQLGPRRSAVITDRRQPRVPMNVRYLFHICKSMSNWPPRKLSSMFVATRHLCLCSLVAVADIDQFSPQATLPAKFLCVLRSLHVLKKYPAAPPIQSPCSANIGVLKSKVPGLLPLQ